MTAQNSKDLSKDSPKEKRLSEITDWLSSPNVNLSPKSLPKIEILAGDGSQRTFYRITTPDTTRILVSDPEWILSKDYAPHQEYLKKLGIPVPHFFERDVSKGFLLMEDLGDELLQFRIHAQPRTKISWLEESVVLLGQLHGKTFPVDPSLPVSGRKFDEKKYLEEFAFTFEHLVRRYLRLTPPQNKELAELKHFCHELERMTPEVFCHRDYHCRNILLNKERLFLIDFQDARLGPPQYDLASLVYDAYVPITEAERESLVALYKKELLKFPVGEKVLWDSFAVGLQRVAFQRTIKAAGSFASFKTRFGKSTHLKYLAPALTYAQNILTKTDVLPPSFKNLFPIVHWLQKLQSGEINEP